MSRDLLQTGQKRTTRVLPTALRSFVQVTWAKSATIIAETKRDRCVLLIQLLLSSERGSVCVVQWGRVEKLIKLWGGIWEVHRTIRKPELTEWAHKGTPIQGRVVVYPVCVQGLISGWGIPLVLRELSCSPLKTISIWIWGFHKFLPPSPLASLYPNHRNQHTTPSYNQMLGHIGAFDKEIPTLQAESDSLPLCSTHCEWLKRTLFNQSTSVVRIFIFSKLPSATIITSASSQCPCLSISSSDLW